MRKGPTQEEMLKANSPQAPSSPAGTADPAHGRSPSVLPVPIMPILATDVDARPSATVSPTPPSLPSPRSSPPPPPTFSTLVTPFNPVPSPSNPSPSSTPPDSSTLSQPLGPPSLASISRSAPFPLPPVKAAGGHSRLHSVTIKPRDLPDTSANPSLNSTLPEPLPKWNGPLPPLTDGSSPHASAKTSAAISRQPSFNSLLATASPSLNLMDPACTSTNIGHTFTHYARKRYDDKNRTLNLSPRSAPDDRPAGDDEVLDKKALGQLATDCVLSFLLTLRLQHAGKWKDEKAKEKKEKELRVKFIPGQSLEEAVEIARLYLREELQAKRGEISRTMFFYHFARCFKAMFVYEKLTVEREALVAKWNALGKQRMEEKKKNKDKDREGKGGKGGGGGGGGGTDGERESSVSNTHSKGGRQSTTERKKKKKNRATAPANSISDLMQSTSSKVLQAEKKLNSTISAATFEKVKVLKKLGRSTDGDEVTEL